ncbi:MAG: hypothetical protein ACM30G_16590 [Micromonosporaceae bacterium]
MALIDTRPAATAPARPRLLWSWTAWTTGGEAVGFCVPAAVATLTFDLPVPVALPCLLLAGAVEGAVLGTAQAHVLRRVLPRLPARRWVAMTSAAAVLAWVIGLLPSLLGDRMSSWPAPILVTAAAIGGAGLLLSIGTAQWTVLRRYVSQAGRWIAVTAIAWLAALAAFMLIAPPLWHEGQPPPVIIAIGIVAGLVMATTMAVVTGLGLEPLVRTARSNDRGIANGSGRQQCVEGHEAVAECSQT